MKLVLIFFTFVELKLLLIVNRLGYSAYSQWFTSAAGTMQYSNLSEELGKAPFK
jgi:hypothetical protein